MDGECNIKYIQSFNTTILLQASNLGLSLLRSRSGRSNAMLPARDSCSPSGCEGGHLGLCFVTPMCCTHFSYSMESHSPQIQFQLISGTRQDEPKQTSQKGKKFCWPAANTIWSPLVVDLKYMGNDSKSSLNRSVSMTRREFCDFNNKSIHPPLQKSEGNWSRNTSHNCFWNRYWGRNGQLLANFSRL